MSTRVSETTLRPGDAFGRLLQDCWRAGGEFDVVNEILERDDGHTITTDAANYFTPYSGWSDAEQEMLRTVRGNVLDVGCGSGRVAVEMQKRGHSVLGIDSSPNAVELCTSRGLTAMEATVPDLSAVTGTFDTIVMAGNGLGLLESRESAPVILNELARVANEGASLLGTTIDPAAFTSDSDVEYRRLNLSQGRLPGQWRMRVTYQEIATEWFSYVFLSVEDLTEIVSETPWSVSDVYEDAPLLLAHLKLGDPAS